MKEGKRDRLEAAGWKVGSTADFLHLSPDEVAFTEMKLGLAKNVRTRRLRRKLTQSQLAKLINSSQSRVAKMEAADASVSSTRPRFPVVVSSGEEHHSMRTCRPRADIAIEVAVHRAHPEIREAVIARLQLPA